MPISGIQNVLAVLGVLADSGTLLWPCLSPTGPVGLIGSDLESGGQVHGNGCEGFGEVIDQHPEEDAKCL